MYLFDNASIKCMLHSCALISNFSAMPFYGKIPILEVDGETIYQFVAICRYLAKQCGLTGNNDWKSLKIDMTVDTMHNLRANE